MKNRTSSITKTPTSQNNNFYKILQQKYQSYKSNCSSIKQSRTRQFSQTSKYTNTNTHTNNNQIHHLVNYNHTNSNSKNTNSKNNKKKQNKQNKNIQIRNLLHVSNFIDKQIQDIEKQYNFNGVTDNTIKISQIIHHMIYVQKPKLVSICICPLLQNIHINQQIPITIPITKQTKTQIITPYIQPLIKQFLKVTISIYSYTSSSSPLLLSQSSQLCSQKQQFYDMLSIRRQIKTDSKLLVQTNICNNNKSSIILKKLMDVARQRQKIMKQQQINIEVIVVKIKAIINVDNDNDKQNGNINQSYGQNYGRQVDIEISCGGYGEIGNRNLLGAQKFRLYFNILQVNNKQNNKFSEIQQKLSKYKRTQKSKLKSQLKIANENQLKSKIRKLQQQLQQKKKQLQQQKQKAAKQKQIQEQLDDLILPSQRPMVSIQKYTKMNIKSKKPSHNHHHHQQQHNRCDNQ